MEVETLQLASSHSLIVSQVPGGGGDSQLAVVVTGVESEEVEEINDAYNDILEELGLVRNDPRFQLIYITLHFSEVLIGQEYPA